MRLAIHRALQKDASVPVTNSNVFMISRDEAFFASLLLNRNALREPESGGEFDISFKTCFPPSDAASSGVTRLTRLVASENVSQHTIVPGGK